MALRLTEKSDIKIFILYLLSRVERPLDFVTLHDICVQDEFINTFDFMDEFYELQKIKAITARGNDVEIRQKRDGKLAIYEIRKKAV